MRLAVKSTSAVFLVLLIMLGVDGYASVQREKNLFIADLRHDGLLVGRTMAGALSDAWRTQGKHRALELVEEADRKDQEVRIRWVWLDTRRPDHQPSVPLHLLAGLSMSGSRILDQIDPGGTRWTYAYVPVETGGAGRGALEVAESMDAAWAYTHTTLVRQGVLAGAIALLGGLALALVSRRLIALPLERMMDKARRIGRGDLSSPLGGHGRDELARLARTLDEMCDHLAEAREKTRKETRARLEAQGQLRHTERLATVGRLSAGLAHELGTPLNVISGRAQWIAETPAAPRETRECAEIIVGQTRRMTEIIRGLLDFARRHPPAPGTTDLEPLIHDVVKLLRPTAEASGVALHMMADDDVPPAWVDRSQIGQVLLNLVMNGIQAVDGNGEVTVALSAGTQTDPHGDAEPGRGHHVVLQVSDTGHGIEASQIPHLFDPFFTTKDVGEGTGLGLSIVYGIVREHDGWIDVTSTPGKGSRFTVHLPCVDPEIPVVAETWQATVSPGAETATVPHDSRETLGSKGEP